MTLSRRQFTQLLASGELTSVMPGLGDADRISHLGQETLGVARKTGSARIQRELRALDAELLERRPNYSESRAFHGALMEGA
ncbi:hypothetical protein ACFXJ8_28675 [Nonomuraea sp. NPDC059194]|uniref:hypothetical protein n=1 Tax=Nonomuraea sp. NPDC059194 TaxID=3346764 RepID=UPI00369F6E7D